MPQAALCTQLVAWLTRDGTEALESMTSAPTLEHRDGTKTWLPGSLSALQGTYRPSPALPLQWGENRCGLLQSGKVVGVVLDLLVSTQDNLVIHLLVVRAILSKWGKGEDQRA